MLRRTFLALLPASVVAGRVLVLLQEHNMTLSAANSTKMWPDENHVGMNLVVTDDDRPDLGAGAQVVIDDAITRQYVKGVDISNETRDEIGNEAQGLIDKYKELRALYDKQVYTDKITQIIGALSL